MQAYLDLLRDIMENGEEKTNRTGTNTIGVFGRLLRFDLSTGFPLLTTKKVHFKSVAIELLWFLKGSTNINFLKENRVTIWNEWANEMGELGPVYGKQWRAWLGADGNVYDQISAAINTLRSNPSDRRIIVSAWKVDEIDKMALPPCHVLFQFNVTGKKLSLLWFQRSVDTFLGLPFNIASYALLLQMMAQITGLIPGDLIASLGDTHLYVNHLEQVKLQLSRTPRELPKLELNWEICEIDDFSYADINLVGYNPYPAIPAPIAI